MTVHPWTSAHVRAHKLNGSGEDRSKQGSASAPVLMAAPSPSCRSNNTCTACAEAATF